MIYKHNIEFLEHSIIIVDTPTDYDLVHSQYTNNIEPIPDNVTGGNKSYIDDRLKKFNVVYIRKDQDMEQLVKTIIHEITHVVDDIAVGYGLHCKEFRARLMEYLVYKTSLAIGIKFDLANKKD